MRRALGDLSDLESILLGGSSGYADFGPLGVGFKRAGYGSGQRAMLKQRRNYHLDHLARMNLRRFAPELEPEYNIQDRDILNQIRLRKK